LGAGLGGSTVVLVGLGRAGTGLRGGEGRVVGRRGRQRVVGRRLGLAPYKEQKYLKYFHPMPLAGHIIVKSLGPSA
jgi:hypothetical protein